MQGPTTIPPVYFTDYLFWEAMGCAPGQGYDPKNEKGAYWMAGYVKGRTGLAVQCHGAHAVDIQFEAADIKSPADYTGRRWWSEIDCGPLFHPYVEWDCVCVGKDHPGRSCDPGIAGTARPSYRLCDL